MMKHLAICTTMIITLIICNAETQVRQTNVAIKVIGGENYTDKEVVKNIFESVFSSLSNDNVKLIKFDREILKPTELITIGIDYEEDSIVMCIQILLMLPDNMLTSQVRMVKNQQGLQIGQLPVICPSHHIIKDRKIFQDKCRQIATTIVSDFNQR